MLPISRALSVAALSLAFTAALAAIPQEPLRVGGAITAPLKVTHVDPVYPEAARAAGISGTVRVQVLVGADGSVQNALAIGSVPMLDQAALDAVHQWTYTPTLLNGRPTAIIMDVDVPVPYAFRVGGAIRAPIKVVDASPIYPPEAQAARIQGVVILELMIGADGRVQNTRVLKSVPQLDDAAVAAASQWVFTPTWLNGIPVNIIYNVTVTFQTPQ